MNFNYKKEKSIFVITAVLLFIINILCANKLVYFFKGKLESEFTKSIYNNTTLLNIKLQSDLNNMVLLSSHLDKEVSVKKFKEYLNSVYEKDKFPCDDLLISDKHGNGYTLISNTKLDIRDANYFKESMKGKKIVSKSIVDNSKDKAVYSVPIYNGSDVDGVLAVRFDLSKLIKTLSDISKNDKYNVYIVDSNGDIISQDNNEELLSRTKYENINDIYPVNNKNEYSSNNNGIKTYKIKEKNKFVSYKEIESMDSYYVVLSIERKHILSEMKDEIHFYFILLVSQMLIYFIFAAYIYIKNKKNTDLLKTVAYIDRLTGMSNIDKFKCDIKEIININNKKYYIINMDVLNFKSINGLFGNEEGDLLLKYIANILMDYIKEDELCARFNSDKFILCLKSEKEKDILDKIKEIENRIVYYKLNKDTKCDISCSYVIYEVMDINIDLDNLFNDLNIYHTRFKDTITKCSNSVRYSYYSENIKTKVLNERVLADGLDEAIKNDEFILYVQPKYNIKTNEIWGVEGLVRWNHKGSMIYPDIFIPLFEEDGQIIKIDMLMVEKACISISNCIKANKNVIPIAINISRRSLYEEEFVNKILSVLEKYNVSTDLIEIEITETMAYENKEIFTEIIQSIRNAGFKVYIDDFGKGYSCLNMLKDIEVDYIKLDGNFLLNSELSDDNKVVISSIVNMIKSLNMKVVAECVETSEQLEFLKEIKCDVGQGYLLHKPIDIVEFEKGLS